MTPDPPFTAARVYSVPRLWMLTLAVAVVLVLALVGVVAGLMWLNGLVHGGGA